MRRSVDEAQEGCCVRPTVSAGKSSVGNDRLDRGLGLDANPSKINVHTAVKLGVNAL